MRGAIEMARKLPGYARLVWALLRDPRVPAPQKLILAGIVGYLLMPIDIIPDFLPIAGQLDDVAVVLLGLDLFIRSAPAAVVDEHLARIQRNEDDLRKDMDEVQRLLGDTFGKIRDDLERILARQRGRFKDADEAGDELGKWQDRHTANASGKTGRRRKGETSDGES